MSSLEDAVVDIKKVDKESKYINGTLYENHQSFYSCINKYSSINTVKHLSYLIYLVYERMSS